MINDKKESNILRERERERERERNIEKNRKKCSRAKESINTQKNNI